ncbi:hypothetical protein CPB86DRAFT_809698 [Serendipita vermifera]|nr:hypothetical protein CPB86DRAFT_809698 [Serendipita vermifera]
MICPGAPKLPFFESFEGPFFVDDELLAYYNRISSSLAQPELSLEEVDRDMLVCPGAPKIGFFEEYDGLGIMADEPLFCHNCVSPTTSPSFESHLEDEDRDKLVCPGAPKLEYSGFIEGLNVSSDEPLVRHGSFNSPVSTTWGLDSNDEAQPQALVGPFPEADVEPSVTFRICSVPMCRDSEVTSESTTLSTPPPPNHIQQTESDLEEKEVIITSDLVIAGEAVIDRVSR